jgi:4-hydroxy-tetrahydrodipicolinate synthase
MAPAFLSAISTPFRPDGSPDLDAFSAHLAWLAEAGLDGVFVAGTTGEGVLLEDDEVAALVERAVGIGTHPPLRVVAQVGRPSTRATVRLARRAIELGADAVAAYVPWFYPATDDDVRGHFLALLEAAGGTPAFLYNIPRRTVNDLSAELVGELARAGYAGMKDSTADFARHDAYLEALAGRDFELFIGAEPLVLRSCRLGSAGAVTGLAGCRPELFAALREALAAGDDEAADRAQAEITAAKDDVEAEGSTVAAVKKRVAEALAERGVDYPPAPRAPFR